MQSTDTLQITPEVLRRIDPHRGSMLCDRDVEQLLSNLEIKSCATRDQQEVAGYAELMDVVFSSWQDIPFTENHIKQLHQVLLRYSEKDAWHRGDYKTHSNSVAACDETGAPKDTIRTGSPDRQPWLVFFLRSLAEQVRRLEKKIERGTLDQHGGGRGVWYGLP